MTDLKKATASAAAEYAELGLSTIPVDSHKMPTVAWKRFQENRPTALEISRLFGNGHFGVAVIAGEVSGGLEVIDVDVKYCLDGSLMKEFSLLIKDHSPELFEKLVIAKTVNSGFHIFYRSEHISGNQKLAQRPATPEEAVKGDKVKALIETRGEGGFVVAAPTHGYDFVQGDFSAIQTITNEERDLILAIARSFDQMPTAEEQPHATNVGGAKEDGVSPGIDYNDRGDVVALLRSHGWTEVAHLGERIHFKRPGVTDSKVSGNYHTGLKTFFVFSTSTDFESGKGYSPAAVYTQLEHAGDFKAAYRCLYEAGYGSRRTKGAKPIDSLTATLPGEGLLSIKSVNTWIDEAKTAAVPKMLFGPFIFEGEISVLFGDTGANKTALAVQICDSSTTGRQILGLPMDGDPADTLILDFEMSSKQFEGRYSQDYQNHYHFDERFRRSEINRNCIVPDGIDFETWLNREIEAEIQATGIKRLVVDNITYLRSATETAKDALPLMKDLMRLKQKYGLTILILAHTPKRDQSRPITVNDLQGSKMLSNFADSIFAIGKSSTQPGIRYLKQIKARSSEEIYHGENVIVCKVTKPTNFLGLEFVEFGSETDHLLTISDKVTAQDRGEMFLRQYLSNGERLQSEVERSAEEKGIRPATLQRAKRSLQITSKKVGFPGVWYWSLPEGDQDDTEDEGGHVPQDDHLRGKNNSNPNTYNKLAEGVQVDHLRVNKPSESDRVNAEGTQDDHLRKTTTKQKTYSGTAAEGDQRSESEHLRKVAAACACGTLGFIGYNCRNCGEIITDILGEIEA